MWGPQVDILAKGPFWINFEVPENILLRGNDFVVGILGIPHDPNELYGPWDPFGYTTLPQTMFFHCFLGISAFAGKLGQGPACCPDLLAVYLVFYAA